MVGLDWLSVSELSQVLAKQTKLEGYDTISYKTFSPRMCEKALLAVLRELLGDNNS